MSYVKTNWQTGDTVTAEKLNNLENGVANAYALILDLTGTTFEMADCKIEGQTATISGYICDGVESLKNAIKPVYIYTGEGYVPTSEFMFMTTEDLTEENLHITGGHVLLMTNDNGEQYFWIGSADYLEGSPK